jgi:hypothetical protein
MAVRQSARPAGSSWMVWAFWAAGASLLLVELNAGMAYLETGLRQNQANLLGWWPAACMMTLKVAEQSIWHWGTLETLLRGIPLGVLGFLFVGLGLALRKQMGISR